MSTTPYRIVARVVKTRGLNGEVMVQSTDGLPFCLYEGLELWVVPPETGLQRHTSITAASPEGEDTGFVRLQGFERIDEAEALVDRFLLARCEDIAAQLDVFDDLADIIDRAVVDETHGPLGFVTEYLETNANDVLVVEGPYGEVLIPVLDETIIEVPDDIALPIRTAVLPGTIRPGEGRC